MFKGSVSDSLRTAEVAERRKWVPGDYLGFERARDKTRKAGFVLSWVGGLAADSLQDVQYVRTTTSARQSTAPFIVRARGQEPCRVARLAMKRPYMAGIWSAESWTRLYYEQCHDFVCVRINS
jgi:hypothetical protein